ncbi:glomulin [Anopheles darlingi]|uniref:glomulin n=1 Tax=Anopheles darlingi TaxID=43151 RepID=UPI002100487D|nr:glomulin [Anopheles darlingi]
MDILETVIGKLQAGEFSAAKEIIEDPKNDEAIKMQSMELVSLIAENLTEDNAENKPELYSASETLLIALAQKCSPAEVLYEMMEKIRIAQNDDVLTSLLKVVQASILRLPAKRARCLDWVFGTIIEYLERITLPEALDKDMDDEEESLLENDEIIRRFLQLYLTMILFVSPIATRLSKPATQESLYYDTSLTQKNAVVCFILRLMGKLLPYLHLQRSVQPRRTPGRRPFSAGKSYSVQVAEDLTNVLLLLINDPYLLLSYGEKRTHGDRLLKKSSSFVGDQSEQDREDLTSNDVFMSNEKHMTEGLAVLFYLLLGEDLLPTSAPIVYDPRYIFEAGLHYVVELVSGVRTVVYFKGIRLAQALVRKLNGIQLTALELETPIHTTFCERYIRALERSKSVRNREVGVRVLSEYIRAFNDEGRYTILVHLLKSFEDDTVRSFAINEYKDLVTERLREATIPLPPWYSGEMLREMLIGRICTLKHGVKTDLLDHNYSITSALSALWVLLKSDLSNMSRVWDCLPVIEKKFLTELRTGLDFSLAHYKNELKNTEEGSDEGNQSTGGLNGADISISTLNGEAPPPVMSKETRIDLSKCMILRLEMLEFHLSRITSDIEQIQTQIRKSGSLQTIES